MSTPHPLPASRSDVASLQGAVPRGAQRVVRQKPFDWVLAIRAIAAWVVTLLIVFPIVFLVMTAFKTELQAIHVPTLWVFTPTLENFHEVQERSNYLHYAYNSIVTSVGSTLLGLAIAAPAAY